MPADYIDMPAHIATRVAVAADLVCRTGREDDYIELVEALGEAREAERVTVEKVMDAIIDEEMIRGGGPSECAKAALRAAGYTVSE